MRIYISILILIISIFEPINAASLNDSIQVKKINNKGYEIRLTDPEQTIIYAKQAFNISTQINYKEGIAESYRVKGIGFHYLEQRDSSIINYFKALSIFKKIKDELGEAKVLNNIGNTYNQYNNDKALEYYLKTLKIAKKHNKKDLIAGCYLNIGSVYYRKKNFNLSLINYNKSYATFKQLNNSIGLTQCLQNMGVIYTNLNNLEKAESTLQRANKMAKTNELNTTVASINLTLSSIAINKGEFNKADAYINEGIAFAKLVKNDKFLYDYTLTSYELETKRNNYKKALNYLEEVHRQDNEGYRNSINNVFKLSEEQAQQLQIQKENELTIERQKRTRTLFIASTAVALLSFVVIFLLIRSNRITEKSNKDLHLLNNEVSRQKDNVDKINHKLEEIIAERTKDLLSKNQKLSEYSSHLSHQIRGPVATLKGLIMLSQDDLIEEKECIGQMKKCVDDIDEKIMDINIALHDPDRHGLSSAL